METLMDEVCGYLHNYFVVKPDGIRRGEFTISNKSIDLPLQTGQYFRVVGSVFNDGVWKYPASQMTNESFDGEIWAMAVPPAVMALIQEIESWNTKYGDNAYSPYQSESFGGYSYTKASGASTNGGDASADWRSVFGGRLNRWRKIA